MTQYKQVTVFGGTGFIGRYVVDRLADLGMVVHVATRSPASAYFLRTAGTVGQVVPVQCNIHDDVSVFSALHQSDFVINLVGTLVQRGRHGTFENIHHDFPRRLAMMAARSPVKRLVHVSALAENGPGGMSDYARTKLAGENAVREYFPQATILRPSVVYGAEDSFFNFFARMAGIAPFLPLVGGGHTLFQPVYVGDVADAVVRSLTLPAMTVQGKTFDLVGDEKASFRELMEKMMRVTCVQKPFLPIPFALARIQGAVFQNLPGKFLTVDQVRQLRHNSISDGINPDLYDLGITPQSMDAILPTYLKCYRPGGRFARKHAA